MSGLDLADKRVLIRADLNAPIENGKVRSDARLKAVLPTLQAALSQRARVILMSHLGRPQEGKPDPQFSLAPVAEKLGELLGRVHVLIEHPIIRTAGRDGCDRERIR